MKFWKDHIHIFMTSAEIVIQVFFRFPFLFDLINKLKLEIHLFLDKSNRHAYRSSRQQWTSDVGKSVMRR